MAERTNPNEATPKEIQEFFGMSASQMMVEWKQLSPDERLYFKTAVAEALDS